MEIRPEQSYSILDLGRSCVVIRGHADRNGGECSPEVGRPIRLPWGQIEVQPCPSTFPLPSGELKLPQILERLSRFVRQVPLVRVTIGKDQRIQDGFDAPRLAGFGEAERLIWVERIHFVPQCHSLLDVLQQMHLGNARAGLTQDWTQHGTSQGVR